MSNNLQCEVLEDVILCKTHSGAIGKRVMKYEDGTLITEFTIIREYPSPYGIRYEEEFRISIDKLGFTSNDDYEITFWGDDYKSYDSFRSAEIYPIFEAMLSMMCVDNL